MSTAVYHRVGAQRHQWRLMKVPVESVSVLGVHRMHSMWVVVMVVVVRLVWVVKVRMVRVVSHMWVHHMSHVAVHGTVAYMAVAVIVDP